jgi:hypothetical protein
VESKSIRWDHVNVKTKPLASFFDDRPYVLFYKLKQMGVETLSKVSNALRRGHYQKFHSGKPKISQRRKGSQTPPLEQVTVVESSTLKHKSSGSFATKKWGSKTISSKVRQGCKNIDKEHNKIHLLW